MKFVSIKDSYDRAKVMFGGSLPKAIAGDLRGNINVLRKMVNTQRGVMGISPDAILFLGDVLDFGPETRKVIHNGFMKGLKTLRGRKEDIVLQILEAAVEGRAQKLSALAEVWNHMGGGAVLGSFLEQRDLAAVTQGMCVDHRTILTDIRDGKIKPEAVTKLITSILGEDVVAWLKSLPSALVFTESEESTKCMSAFIFTRGALDTKMINDCRLITEDQAVWSEGDRTDQINSSDILYSIFGVEKMDPRCIVKQAPMGWDPTNNGFRKISGYYCMPPGTRYVAVRPVNILYIQGQLTTPGTWGVMRTIPSYKDLISQVGINITSKQVLDK